MEHFIAEIKEKWYEIRTDPKTKQRFFLFLGSVIAIIGIIIAFLIVRLGKVSAARPGGSAADLITTRSVTTDISVAAERNEAGGL